MKSLYEKIVDDLHSISYKDFDKALIISEEEIIKGIGNVSDLEEKDNYGRTLLLYAALYSRNKCIEKLCEMGANVNTQDEKGWTPLHAAISFNNLEGVKMLLANGAKIETKDIFGNTPIHKLKHYDSDEIAKVLLANGANPHEKITEDFLFTN